MDASDQHGHGREVEDDELFGDPFSQVLPSSRSRQGASPVKAPVPKRRRVAPRVPPLPAVEKSSNGYRPRLKPVSVEANEAVMAEITPTAPRQAARASPERKSVNVLRSGLDPSPKTYEACIAQFSNSVYRTPEEKEEDEIRLKRAPKLSSLALGAARRFASSGKLKDLSRVADDYVYEILCFPSVGPALLVELEKWNPTRVNVFEAIWARLVQQKYSISMLPEGTTWWRSLYEAKEAADANTLERARERLRLNYSQAEAVRQSRNVATTGLLRTVTTKRRRRRGASSSSMPPQTLMARLRMEERRARRNR